MSKIALLSDIHGNLEALEAVLKHIDALDGIDSIYCLGDMVGYGPDPVAVVDLIRKRCSLCLMGNHDHAVITQPIGFNALAAGAARNHRKQLEPGLLALPGKRDRWEFLHRLPESKEEGPHLFVHASPRDKIFEYILPGDITMNPSKMEDIFAMIQNNCFVGHTHVPGVMLQSPPFLSLEEINYEYTFDPKRKAIFNVSSVGQPRDRDPRACYAVIEESGIRWHRVEYDIQKTIAKVKDNPGLDERCGTRLLEGK